MSDVAEVEIPIRIECELTEGWGGERWDVKDVKDKRTDTEIGDIGIYDFDAHSDFSETLINAVMANLEEYDYFEPRELFYSVTVNIYDGGSRLGFASRHFYGYQLSSNKNTLEEHSEPETQ